MFHCYNMIYCASSFMFQAIADPTTNLHQPAVTPLPTKHSERDRVVGNKLRPAPLAAAANWECDGLCGNSKSGSHPWYQHIDACCRNVYYCKECAFIGLLQGASPLETPPISEEISEHCITIASQREKQLRAISRCSKMRHRKGRWVVSTGGSNGAAGMEVD